MTYYEISEVYPVYKETSDGQKLAMRIIFKYKYI